MSQRQKFATLRITLTVPEARLLYRMIKLMVSGAPAFPMAPQRLTLATIFARLELHPIIQAQVPEYKERR